MRVATGIKLSRGGQTYEIVPDVDRRAPSYLGKLNGKVVARAETKEATLLAILDVERRQPRYVD